MSDCEGGSSSITPRMVSTIDYSASRTAVCSPYLASKLGREKGWNRKSFVRGGAEGERGVVQGASCVA